MKKYLVYILIISLSILSCSENKTYYDEIVSKKSIKERIEEINQPLISIRKTEKKSSLVKEDEDYLEYEYSIGIDESYVVSYFFDVAGCYEVGIDTYLNSELEAKNINEKIIEEINNSNNFKLKIDSNQLIEWVSNDGKKSIELDYENISKGMISFTVFANE